jgi:N-acetylmuramoyl-L-alanine amidase
VLNRVDSPAWPNTIREVIYQPGQFSVVSNGALDRAYGNAPQVAYDAVLSQLQSRYNYDIIYFSMGYNANGTIAFTHGTHYYSV